MVAMLTALVGVALAAPFRAASTALHLPPPTNALHRQRVVIKLAEDQGLSFVAGRLSGPPDELHETLTDAQPLFSRPRASLLAVARHPPRQAGRSESLSPDRHPRSRAAYRRGDATPTSRPPISRPSQSRRPSTSSRDPSSSPTSTTSGPARPAGWHSRPVGAGGWNGRWWRTSSTDSTPSTKHSTASTSWNWATTLGSTGHTETASSGCSLHRTRATASWA